MITLHFYLQLQYKYELYYPLCIQYVKYCGHLFPSTRWNRSRVSTILYPENCSALEAAVHLDNRWHRGVLLRVSPHSVSWGLLLSKQTAKIWTFVQANWRLCQGHKRWRLAYRSHEPKTIYRGSWTEGPICLQTSTSCVFLNVTALKSKEVYYRPELQVL